MASEASEHPFVVDAGPVRPERAGPTDEGVFGCSGSLGCFRIDPRRWQLRSQRGGLRMNCLRKLGAEGRDREAEAPIARSHDQPNECPEHGRAPCAARAARVAMTRLSAGAMPRPPTICGGQYNNTLVATKCFGHKSQRDRNRLRPSLLRKRRATQPARSPHDVWRFHHDFPSRFQEAQRAEWQ